MKAILIAIGQKLKDVEGIKHSDENWGQLTGFGPNIPVQWPCAVYDIENGNFSNLGRDRSKEPQNRQQGLMSVAIDFAHLKLTNTSARSPLRQRNDAWALSDIVEAAHKQLHGWSPAENCTGLMRTSMRKIQREDGVQQYRVTYTFTANDV